MTDSFNTDLGAKTCNIIKSWDWRMLLRGSLWGLLATVVPLLTYTLFSQSSTHVLNMICVGLMLPGAAVAIIAAAGQIHDTNNWVIISTNFLFYSTLAYMLMKARHRRSEKARGRSTIGK